MKTDPKSLILAGAATVLLLTGGCIFQPAEKNATAVGLLSIRFGTTFGFCLGYCNETLTLDAATMEMSRTGRGENGTLPELRFQLVQDSTRWSALVSKWQESSSRFSELDEVIGCPDCTDGGAEWIEVRTSGGTKKVTYEYGSELDGLGDFQRHLRSLMQEMKMRINTTSGILQFSDGKPEDILFNPLALRSGRIEGDSLYLEVAYSGGCAEHRFDLVMAPAVFLESYPVQANLYLRHDAGGDLCKAYIHKTLSFDLSELKRRYVQAYGSTGSTASETLLLNIFVPQNGSPVKGLQIKYLLDFEG